MPLKLRTELDDRSLDDVRSQAQSIFDAIGLQAGEAFTGGINQGLAGLGSGGRIFAGVSDAAASMGTGVAAGAAIGVTGIGLLLVAVEQAGEALYGVGERFDTIADTISARTGAMGSDLDAMTDSVRRLGATTASSLEQLADIGTGVSQAFDMPQASLDALTKQVADFNRITGDTANVREFGMAIRAFGDDAPTAGVAFEQLADLMRQTGIPINEIIDDMRNLAPATQALGLDFNQTAGLIQSFNAAGIDAGTTMMALNRASGVFADNGINMQTGLRDTITQMQEFIATGRESEARILAGDVFGERAAGRMVQAIKDGTINVASLNDGLITTGNTIDKIVRSTDDWEQNWIKIKNRVSDVAEEIGGPLFDNLNAALAMTLDPSIVFSPDAAGDARQALQDALDRAQAGGPPPPPQIGGSGSGLGHTPYDASGWGPRQDIAGALAADAGGSAKAPPVPYPPGYTGTPVEKAQHDVDQARADLAAASASGDPAAIVTAQNRLTDAGVALRKANENPAGPAGPGPQAPAPPGLGAPPRPGETAAQYSAEQGYLGAQQTTAQKQLDLQTLQLSGTATADQLAKATNDVTDAQTRENLALLRLNEASQTATQALDDIGVALDSDLGLSKGLPGLAENLIRFVGSLAAAPLMGPLSAISQAQGGLSATGSGLIGMAASQGAFGPQFVPQTSAMGPGALQPSYSSGGIGGTPYTGGAVTGGGSYGLPSATNTGGYGTGTADTFPPWVMALAKQFNVKPSTYAGHQTSDRNESGYAPNPQHQNRGIDWTGSPEDLQRFAEYMASQGPEQVIWQNPVTGGKVGVGGGQVNPGYYPQGTYNQHSNHVHTRTSGPVAASWWQSFDGPGLEFLQPGTTVAQNNTGQPQQVLPPGMPTIMAPNLPGGAGGPPPGPQGATTIGGAGAPTGARGGSQSGGGLFGAAGGMAAMAADMFAPGSGAAVQIAMQEINRAIKFGSQVAGIGVQGLMETFLPTGGSELANNNWITRVAGGFAGMAPQLPNVAGKASTMVPQAVPPLPPGNQHLGAGPRAPGPGVSPVHIENYNVTQTEDRAGADIARHAIAANPMPAMGR